MGDAPQRRRARPPAFSPVDHTISPPRMNMDLFSRTARVDQPTRPVRRNLFSTLSSSSRHVTPYLTSQPGIPDIPQFLPNIPPRIVPEPSRQQLSRGSISSSDDEMVGGRGYTSIPVHQESTRQLPLPRARGVHIGLRRAASTAGRQRQRRSGEDDIVARDALTGEPMVPDPVAVLLAERGSRKSAPTTHGHEEYEDGDDTDEFSDGEYGEERRRLDIEESERRRLAEAIKHHNRDRSRADSDPTELLERVKASMKVQMQKLDDDEWMFCAGNSS